MGDNRISLEDLQAIFKPQASRVISHFGLNGKPKLVRRLSDTERKAVGVLPQPMMARPSRYKSIEDMPIYRRPQARHRYPTDWAVIYPTTVKRLAGLAQDKDEFNASLCAYHSLEQEKLTRAEMLALLDDVLHDRAHYVRRDNPEL